jgi:hypothetical protein
MFEKKKNSIDYIPDSLGKFKRIEKNLDVDDWRASELFEEMLHYCKTHPEFKHSSFLHSVHKFFSDNGFVTAKQYNVLLKIYYHNNMQNMEAFND